MSSHKLKVGLMLGSARDERLCERVAKFVRRAVEKDHVVVMLDPLEIDFPKTQQSMHWFQNPSSVPENIKQLNDKVAGCDALVVISPEYNWSVPPPLADIVDNVPPPTFTWKPCAIIGYSVGPSGGWRGGMQVRQLMGAVGCTVSQKQMGIQHAHQALDADGNPQDEKLEKELNVLLSQVYWLTRALKNHKAIETPPQFTM